ncbi:hypothetical protein GDO86_003040 [Hymenochirus boettgeri]|uniref:Uncharacterized protein n=1 Tax=Hymenochirus boettgeri TaxID=247094 RepID=A0A8T2K1X2_9PIPI|nr:hypothetical protein GDO86_003040 [Hymenochirus boettgeri]
MLHYLSQQNNLKKQTKQKRNLKKKWQKHQKTLSPCHIIVTVYLIGLHIFTTWASCGLSDGEIRLYFGAEGHMLNPIPKINK